jgi:hypothetical protein
MKEALIMVSWSVLADEGVLLEPIPTAVKSLCFFSYFFVTGKKLSNVQSWRKIIIMHGTVKDNEVDCVKT